MSEFTMAQMKQAMKVALSQGQEETARAIAGRIKAGDFKEVESDAKSAALGFSQGATLGLGEEVGSAIRAGTEMFTDPLMAGVSEMFSPGHYTGEDDLGPFARFGRGYEKRTEEFWPEFAEDRDVLDQMKSYAGDFMKRYRTSLGSARGQLQRAREEDPGMYMGGELASGLLQGGAGTTKAVLNAPRTLGAGMKASGLTGGKYGAASGYGYGEGDPIEAIFADDKGVIPELAEAGTEAGQMGVTGVAFGSLLPAVGTGLRNMTRFLTRKGTQKVRLNEVGRRQIAEAIEDDLEMRNLTPEQAQRELKQHGMQLSDLGPNTQRIMEDIGQTGTRAGEVIRDELKTRVAGQYDRVVPKMAKALGLDPSNPSKFQHHMDRLLKTAEDEAGPLYEQAYAKGIRLTDDMVNVLNRTATGKIGRKKATEYAAEALEDIGSPLKRKDIGPGVLLPTKHVDFMIRAMDDHVDKLFRGKGKKGIAREAARRRDEFREAVYKANKPFEQARQAWAGPMQSQRAMEAGTDIFKEGAEAMAGKLSKMSEGERLYYRIGVMKAVEDKLARKKDYADIVSDVKDVRRVRDALEVAFGDSKKFDDFMETLTAESKMQETAQRVLGNSATARRLSQADNDFGEKLASLAGYGVSLSAGGFLPPSIGGYLAGKGFQSLDPSKRLSDAYKQLVAGQGQLLSGQDVMGALKPKTLGGLLNTGVPLSTAPLSGAGASTGILNPNEQYGPGAQ